MHSSNHLNKADVPLHLHQVSLKILVSNWTSLKGQVAVVDPLDLEFVAGIFVVVVGFVVVVAVAVVVNFCLYVLIVTSIFI